MCNWQLSSYLIIIIIAFSLCAAVSNTVTVATIGAVVFLIIIVIILIASFLCFALYAKKKNNTDVNIGGRTELGKVSVQLSCVHEAITSTHK